MKKGKAFLLFLSAGVMLVFMTSTAYASPVVSLELVDGPPVYVGDDFAIKVLADVGTRKIIAFGFDVVWKEGATGYRDAVVATPFEDKSSSFGDGGTRVNGNVPPPDFASGNDVLLATLFFRAFAIGNTSVGIFTDLKDLSKLNDGLFFLWPTPRIDMTSEIEITVTAVPLPSAVFFLGSSVGSLVLRRRLF